MAYLAWLFLFGAAAIAVFYSRFRIKQAFVVTFQNPVEILGKGIPQGSYKVIWEAKGGLWEVSLLRSSGGPLRFSVVEERSRAPFDKATLALNKAPDGKIRQIEIRVPPSSILRVPVDHPLV